MNEEKIKEIVGKVIAENMPNKDEITKKAIEAVKKAEKKENDRPWLIKKGETYYVAILCNGVFKASVRENIYDGNTTIARDMAKAFGRTETEAIEIAKSIKMQRDYEQWCMECPINSDGYNYYAYYDRYRKKIQISTACFCIDNRCYCSQMDHIRAFIDKVGEQNFIKYVMGIGLPKYFLEV